jgi:hypothetical protein
MVWVDPFAPLVVNRIWSVIGSMRSALASCGGGGGGASRFLRAGLAMARVPSLAEPAAPANGCGTERLDHAAAVPTTASSTSPPAALEDVARPHMVRNRAPSS